MRYPLVGAKVAAAALLLFAVPLCVVVTITFRAEAVVLSTGRNVYGATLAGVVGLSMALLAVLREQDPAYTRTLHSYGRRDRDDATGARASEESHQMRHAWRGA